MIGKELQGFGISARQTVFGCFLAAETLLILPRLSPAA